MNMVADTHVHFYPCYDTERAIRTLAANLSASAARDCGGSFGAVPEHPEPVERAQGSPSARRKASPEQARSGRARRSPEGACFTRECETCGLGGGEAAPLACLAERAGGHFLADLRTGALKLPGAGLRVSPATEEQAVTVEEGGRALVTLVAGRQVVTAERIEILALTVDAAIPDGLPAREVVERTLAAGGVPVVAWAPGKWFFSRGGVVRDLFERFQPGQLLVGDTSLRPTAWGMPRLMRSARGKGLGMVAGSDPLPFAGEERWMGTYATLIEGAFDPAAPASSLRRALTRPGVTLRSVGKRCGLLQVLRRLRAHARGTG